MSKLPGFLQPIERAYVKWKMRNSRFKGSKTYWEERYAKGGNSGPGSYDQYAAYKAGVMNDIIRRYDVRSAVEFGCGDGNQLAMIQYPRYLGLDVAQSAIELCQARFAHDASRSFQTYVPERFKIDMQLPIAEMAVSMDVLFHLVEADVYERYLDHLFSAAKRWVVIYARDVDGPQTYHERNREFTPYVAAHMPQWNFIERLPSPFLQEAKNKEARDNVAHFFIYERQEQK